MITLNTTHAYGWNGWRGHLLLLATSAVLLWLIDSAALTAATPILLAVAALHGVAGLWMLLRRGNGKLAALGLGLDLVVLGAALLLTSFPLNFIFALLLLLPIGVGGWRFGPRAALAIGGVAIAVSLGAALLGSEPGSDWRAIVAPLMALIGGGLVLWQMLPTEGTHEGVPPSATDAAADPRVQQVFTRLSQVLSQETNHQRVLQVLLELGAQVVYAQKPQRIQGAALLFATDSTKWLEVKAHLRLDANGSARRVPVEGGVFHEVLSTGEGVITTADHHPLPLLGGLHAREVVVLPLRTALDVYGVVLFASQDELQLDRAGDHRAELLTALVNHCSLSLQNTILQNEVRQGRNEVLLNEEESRHKLARDLHDGPIQRVAAIVMQAEFIRALLKRQPDRVASELDQLQQNARQAAQEMRTLLFTLRPIVLESEGLVAAVNQYVQRLREQERVNIKLESDQIPRLDPQVEEAIFAIVQEAAGNAKKHAGGAPITVRLMTEAGFLIAQVEDKGPGFDVDQTKAGYAQRASLGMVNMQERARMIDGRLDLQSERGRGTVVSLAVPLTQLSHA